MPLNAPYGIDAVNGQVLEEVYRTFTAFLTQSLGAAARWSAALGVFSPLPTRGSEAKAKIGAMATGVHEWVSGREMGQFRFDEKSIVVKKWHSGMNVDMDDLDDDAMNLGAYRPQLADLSDNFEEHKHQLLVKLLANGNVSGNTSYDGKLFFATDHVCEDFRSDDGQAGVTSYSNLSTGALTEATLYDSINLMRKVRKPNGMIANVEPTHIIHPVALSATVDKLLKSTFHETAAGTASKSAPFQGQLVAIPDARLDVESTTAYYLWDSRQALKPFFMADRVPVTTYLDVSKVADRQIVFGAWGRYQMGYGFPHVILKSTGA